MLKDYRQKYETVAIVSHWWVISFLLATKFDEKVFPIDFPDIINAQPYWTSLKQLELHK